MSESKPRNSSVTSFIVKVILLLSLAAFLAAIAIKNFVREPNTSPVNACINNLRQIDACKQQWALDNHKGSNDVPTSAEVAQYLKSNKFPVCPTGGKYTIGRVGEDPTCSIPDHKLPTP